MELRINQMRLNRGHPQQLLVCQKRDAKAESDTFSKTLALERNRIDERISYIMRRGAKIRQCNIRTGSENDP